MRACAFCGEPNRDPEGADYCLTCRGTDWYQRGERPGLSVAGDQAPDGEHPGLDDGEQPVGVLEHAAPATDTVPICGDRRAGYSCLRRPDHVPSAHCSLTDAGMMVWWIPEAPGVKIRRPTFGEHELMQAARGQAGADEA